MDDNEGRKVEMHRKPIGVADGIVPWNFPIIVLDDVNPKEVAPKLFDSAFQNSGQVCIAMKHLYVHDTIYDEVIDELSALAKAAVVGDGLEQGTIGSGRCKIKCSMRR